MSGTVTAVARHDFASMRAEQIYDAWIDPALMRIWMERHLKARDPDAEITRLEIDAVEGGRFHLADTREDSDAWGYYRALARPHRIVFTWFVSAEEEEENTSVVTLDIEDRQEGAVAIMSHEMNAEWADYVEPTSKAWGSMLAAIDEAFR